MYAILNENNAGKMPAEANGSEAVLKEKGEKKATQDVLPAQGASASKWKIISICILVFVVAFMAYANTLKGDFIWDDEYLILNNSQIKSFVHLKNVFKTYVGYGSENINNFYRPVQEISNMIDYFLWGEYPFGFHLTNTVLHALVAVMVFIFLNRLCRDLFVAGVAALFWAVHPVHTEAIAYIAGRADSLYALFMLLSLVFFMMYADKARSGGKGSAAYVMSVLFFVISLLSKEIVIAMPLFIFLYMFFFLRGTGDDALYRKIRWRWAPYAGIVVIYGILRTTVLSFADIAPPSAFNVIPLSYRLLTFFRTILVYFKLMFVPTDLHMERSIPITKSISDPSSIIAFAFIAAVVWIAWKAYKRNRLVSFSIVWFFANLLPVSNIIPINSFLAEHWIYMASIGPFLLLGMGAAEIYRRIDPGETAYRAAFLIGLAAVIGIYGRATMVRNMDWKDEISFFHSTLKYHPKNARLYLNLGNTYYEKGQIEKAVEQYRKAIEINKDYAVAYGNIGSAYLHMKKPDEAEEYLEKAIGIKHNYPIAHYNLGIVYFQRRDYAGAEKELLTATEQLPQLFQAWNMLGRTYLRLGRKEEARAAFQRSLEIMPRQEEIQQILGKIE
jgi:tetratricopeptide (TPR) repeat protein